jgi:hypothetical protein
VKQKIALKDNKLRKQINLKFKHAGSADERKHKAVIATISYPARSPNPESPSIGLKLILDIFLRDFSLYGERGNLVVAIGGA